MTEGREGLDAGCGCQDNSFLPGFTSRVRSMLTLNEDQFGWVKPLKLKGDLAARLNAVKAANRAFRYVAT
ncbi:hypothetical protein DD238_004684 [Peronospora effusa]|uniref:Uncharacterized protein n=1 Tax=Peronospora effusa TaxID=542832 RepID=A0A3M6VME8_9STRA|nr:hypothetical protein DD238_004684 [Peronospora effusa]RQM08934.1 hypothetical protein DD237_008246 [Peronospora effusa]